MIVRRNQYAYAGRGFSDLGDLEGVGSFFRKAGNVVSNVSRYGFAVVTGGGSLLIPKDPFGKDAPPPPPPPPPPTYSYDPLAAVEAQKAREAAAAAGVARGEAAAAASRAAAAKGAAEAARKAAEREASVRAAAIEAAKVIGVAAPGAPGVQAIQQPSMYITPPAPKTTPNWLLPAGIGVGVLVLLFVFKPKAVQ